MESCNQMIWIYLGVLRCYINLNTSPWILNMAIKYLVDLTDGNMYVGGSSRWKNHFWHCFWSGTGTGVIFISRGSLPFTTWCSYGVLVLADGVTNWGSFSMWCRSAAAGLVLTRGYWPALLLPEGTHPSACGCWLLLLLPEVTCPMASVSGLPLDWYLLVLLPEGTCTSTCGSRLLLDWNWLVLLAESTWLSMWYRRTPGLVLAGVVSPGYPPCGMWSRYAGLVILVLWWRLPKLPLIKCWLWH